MPFKFNPLSGQFDYYADPHDAFRQTAVASAPLSGQRVVTTDVANELVYASQDSLDGRSGPLWLTSVAAGAGESIPVVTGGEFEEPSWSWTPKLRLWLGLNGQLTQTPPDSPALFSVRLGVALTPTLIYFDPSAPIILAA